MNKKVDEEFKHIHDEYLLQCTCTEMKDKINNLQSKIDKAIELVKEYKSNNYTKYYENEIEIDLINDLEDILKEDK